MRPMSRPSARSKNLLEGGPKNIAMRTFADFGKNLRMAFADYSRAIGSLSCWTCTSTVLPWPRAA